MCESSRIVAVYCNEVVHPTDGISDSRGISRRNRQKSNERSVWPDRNCNSIDGEKGVAIPDRAKNEIRIARGDDSVSRRVDNLDIERACHVWNWRQLW
jgi:hypothetical protein